MRFVLDFTSSLLSTLQGTSKTIYLPIHLHHSLRYDAQYQRVDSTDQITSIIRDIHTYIYIPERTSISQIKLHPTVAKMHAHIQSSIGAALANATMQILLPQQEYNSSSLSAALESHHQISDAVIALAMPYSSSNGHNQEFRALLTRHPQYSRAVNIFFLVLVLTWAFWERIIEGVKAVDEWLVEETMREEQRAWRGEYWRQRSGWKPVGILKRRRESVCETQVKWAHIENANRRRRGVTFAQDVKDFDGENEDGCWDLCEGLVHQAPLNCVRF